MQLWKASDDGKEPFARRRRKQERIVMDNDAIAGTVKGTTGAMKKVVGRMTWADPQPRLAITETSITIGAADEVG